MDDFLCQELWKISGVSQASRNSLPSESLHIFRYRLHLCPDGGQFDGSGLLPQGDCIQLSFMLNTVSTVTFILCTGVTLHKFQFETIN